METLGNGGLWGWSWEPKRRRPRPHPHGKGQKSSDSVGGGGPRFPLKQAATAASLALAGDTIAQLSERWRNKKASKRQTGDAAHDSNYKTNDNEDFMQFLLDHDLLRSLRMASYGFLLYGPGSYAWYQYLDHSLPKQTVRNLVLKVLLNQIVLGPCVIAVVFAWNSLWQGKLSELPGMYQKDALPTLLFGFRFWIPVSVLNFWYISLPFFMSLDVDNLSTVL